jgi:tripartite-type tricarboxylate transporter receptor subunit TctC
MDLAVSRLGAVCAITLGAAAIAASTAAQTQEWPSHPILVISPFVSGTTNDIVARLVLGPVGAELGQPFSLENRPGGDGTVGVAAAVKAAPDGYTFLLSSSALSAAVILHKSLPYDVLHDLEPVAMFGGEPSMLMAAPGKGYGALADLVAAAKANPGQIKFASVGVGSASYIAGQRFALAAGLDAGHVLYPGPGEALADLTAGEVDYYFIPVTPALPLITQGKAVPLAVSTPNRLQSLPGLPTLAESGYGVPVYLTWCGLAAPANMPREIVDKLNAAIRKALDLPSVRSKLLQTGYLPLSMSAEQAGAFFADDVTSMIKFGKEAHVDPLE